MNKKIIVMILAVFMILSIVSIYVFNGYVSSKKPPRVEEVFFVDKDGNKIDRISIDINDIEINKDGKYVIEVQLNYVINPSDSLDPRLQFKIYNVGDTSKLEEVVNCSNEGLITITLDSLVSLTIPIVATCFDKNATFSGKFAKIDIELVAKSGGDIGDI